MKKYILAALAGIGIFILFFLALILSLVVGAYIDGQTTFHGYNLEGWAIMSMFLLPVVVFEIFLILQLLSKK